MKKIIPLTILLQVLSCSTNQKAPDNFKSMKGCFLLFNLKTKSFEKVMGQATCQERFPACSSFKIPLAVMAFDSGILKDENQILKWDGKKRFLDNWNQDQDAQSWMKESVVWFSQRLTPKLGKKRFQKYLHDFKYGNESLDGGVTQAWLNPPGGNMPALTISAYEQVDFMSKLWTHDLPVTRRAMDITQKITYLETSPKGFKLSGKTGSNFFDKDHKMQFGWFISHLRKGDKEYIVVTNISDLKPIETKLFGGARAKEITKNILAEQGLW